LIFFYRLLLFTALLTISILAFLPDYSELPPIVSISDLLNHTVAFIVLTLLFSLSFTHQWKYILSVLFLYALFIESVQSFLPTRCASIEDIVADSVGMLIGYLISKGIEKIRPDFTGRKKIN
jgi:VanZ family protein